jgi:GAF domain-containing protein
VTISDENDGRRDAGAQLNRVLVDHESLEDRLQRVAALTCSTVSTCDMAAITLLRDGRPSTEVCTDPTTREIDAAQYAAGSGPCLDAYRRRQAFRIASTRTDPRWPEFARAARDHGILSTLSLPMFAGARAFGALNLYSRKERAFSEEHEALASELAEQASVVLADAELRFDRP